MLYEPLASRIGLEMITFNLPVVPLKPGTSVVLLLVARNCLHLTGILTSMQGKQNDNLRSEVALNLIHTQDGCTITKLNGHNLRTIRSSLSNTSSFGR